VVLNRRKLMESCARRHSPNMAGCSESLTRFRTLRPKSSASS
jgi:hypothetical protein